MIDVHTEKSALLIAFCGPFRIGKERSGVERSGKGAFLALRAGSPPISSHDTLPASLNRVLIIYEVILSLSYF